MTRLFAIVLILVCAVVPVFAHATLGDTLSGVVRGTTATNHTYFVRDSLIINPSDTLVISSGDTLIMQSPLGWIHILGTLICDGSSTNRNVITVPASRGVLGPGQWGGIVGDSCKYFEMKYTNVYWAGGNDVSGHAYRTIDIYSDYANTTSTVFTDDYVVGTVDDCIGLHGGTASVLRNVIKWCGAPDGDNINVKDGTIGEIAYNVIWASGGNGIKLNADPTLPRLTNMCVHNNTIVAGGWRRFDELGYAILVDASARAQIYNNIMGDMYEELEITSAADTVRTVYDNNLFFSSADSLGGLTRFYPSDGVGRQAPHDVIAVSPNILFKSYRPYFANDWTMLDGSNDYRILSASAAAGHGFTPPNPTGANHWTNPYFGNASTNLPGDANIGALAVATVASGVGNRDGGSVSSFSLNQNYPNPFNPSTVISYQVPTNTRVNIVVFDLLGREVKSLVNGQQSAGFHTVTFDASALPSGVYLYRLEAGSYSATRKMLLLK